MSVVHVVFGTESGNAQGLAARAGEALEKAQLPHRVVDMLDLDASTLPAITTLVVITSTYGNGDPPSNAEALHAFLFKQSPPLPGLTFAVFGLGDTTYDRFAQCGKDFDARLAELGARRLLDRVDADVDYEGLFEAWLQRLLPKLQAVVDEQARSEIVVPPAPPSVRAVDLPGTRRNPVPARVLANHNLNGAGSSKTTHHLALATDALPQRYVAGDSIGIWPTNDPSLVDAVLSITKLDGSARVTLGDREASLCDALTQQLEIQAPDLRLCDRVFSRASLEDRQRALRENHVIDLLGHSQDPWTAQELIRHLRPLAPRLYSIASSPLQHPSEVHLLVDILSYPLLGTQRFGVTSRHVVERAPLGSRLSIYHHPTPSFRLVEPERDIVMIGPGTGVAPFRAFLQERQAQRATGRAWLFFGARQGATDFLYQDDWRAFQAAGVLNKLDVAFSRDQPEKIYVQHRMQAAASELHAWIAGGAAVYVCGEAHHMAPDVEATLLTILAEQGQLDGPAARASLSKMAEEKRYQRDVY